MPTWTTPPTFTVGEDMTAALMNDLSVNLQVLADLLSPQSFTPAAPTGTTSTTGVMMGLGGTITFTPQTTGTLVLNFNGTYAVGSTTCTIGLRYGTGTAPNNGNALTGTLWGSIPNLTTSGRSGWGAVSRVTGFTVGTTYWFDLSLATGNSADTANLYAIFAIIQETF